MVILMLIVKRIVVINIYCNVLCVKHSIKYFVCISKGHAVL